MTRAHMRDWVRRMLGVVPPVDTTDPDAQVGDAPVQQPYPTNALIDQCIDNAARFVNAHLGIASDADLRSLAVPAQTADGPYRIPLGSLGTQGPALGVRSAFWNSGAEDALLQGAAFRDLDRDGIVWSDMAVGTPRYIIVDGTSVYLLPGPSAAGTLKLRCATGLIGPQTDSEGFRGIPEELETNVLYLAIVELAATLAGDTEMAQRARAFSEMASVSLDALARALNSQNDRYSTGFVPSVYRRPRRR